MDSQEYKPYEGDPFVHVFGTGDRVMVSHSQELGHIQTVYKNAGTPTFYDVLLDGGQLVRYGSLSLEYIPEEQGETSVTKSDGGPSSYYDFDPGWNTFNDFMEHKAITQWGGYSLHLKDLMKAGCRFGTKEGTTDAYDARKMIYSALRLLGMIEGHDAMREELEKLLKDKQFEVRE